MSEEVKAKQTRAKRVDIKIAKGDHDKLERYANAINSSPTKIVNSWVKQHLESEEVKKALEEGEELIQMEKDLEKKEKDYEKRGKEITDLKAKIKAKKDSKRQN